MRCPPCAASRLPPWRGVHACGPAKPVPRRVLALKPSRLSLSDCKENVMWYFAWVLGVGFAVLLAILNAMWGETEEGRKAARGDAR